MRELRGFDTTQEEFAQAIGVSQSQLSHIERGESKAGAEFLLRVSEACEKWINWILTGKDV